MAATFEIDIQDTSGAANAEWAAACRDLYLDLTLQMDGSEIKSRNDEGIATDRVGLEILQQLIVSGVSLGVFTGIYNVLKLWLENRPTAEVTMTYPDGFMMKVSKLTFEQAKALHEQHAQAKPKRK
jgi:hypothetical protein